MLRQAEVKGVYDALRAGDIDEFLEEWDQKADLVLAGDVFIYLGSLDRTVGLIAGRMQERGLLCFSVEAEVPRRLVDPAACPAGSAMGTPISPP